MRCIYTSRFLVYKSIFVTITIYEKRGDMVNVNLGYVAIALKLEDSSPNKTTTYKTLSKINKDLWDKRLLDIAIKNIKNTERIIKYNNAYGVKLYRLTSKLIPLATHKELENWDWEKDLKPYFKSLGETIKKYNIRVSFHPDHFVLLNSLKEEVLHTSIKDLEYHSKMCDLMELDNIKLVLHIGGMYGDKDSAIQRFYKGFELLDKNIKKKIILENDDKIYTAEDVLNISEKLGVPMVLDVHHDFCNPSSISLDKILKRIYNTWENQNCPPKLHFSSPKSEKDFRAHSDYINSVDFLRFLNISKKIDGRHIDIMIESKKKDLSIYKLIEEIKSEENIEVLSDSSFIFK